MAKRLLLALAASGWLACASPAPDPDLVLEVATYRASETSAHLNAHLITGRRDALLVDATMTVSDATTLADWIAQTGLRLRTIFITNSQPDKYLGLPVLVARFPEAKVVATPEVVADIEARGPGYLERLRERYGDEIPDRLVVPTPLEGDVLKLERVPLEIHRFEGGECPHAAALYVPRMRAFFAGALVFEGAHLFLANHDIPGWRAHLDWIRSHGGIDVIYPAHGEATDLAVLDAMSRYLDDFEMAIAWGDADTAVARMIGIYPEYDLTRLLREYSVPAYLPRPER